MATGLSGPSPGSLNWKSFRSPADHQAFLHAVAESDAEPLAAADGNKRLRQLETRVERIRPRIHEAGQALHAIRLQDRQCRDGGHAEHEEHDEITNH